MRNAILCCLAVFASSADGLLPGSFPMSSGRAAAACSRVSPVNMAGATALAAKTKVLESVHEVMDETQLMFCVRSEGLMVNEMNDLRQKLPEGVTLKCVKNTLINIAVQDHEHYNADNIKELLHYSNYWFFVPETQMRDSVKLWNDWLKEKKKENVIVGGVFGAEVLDTAGIEAVSKLPTKQELMGKTASLLKCLPQKIARSVKEAGAVRIARGVKEARGSKMARAVKAASEKMPQ
uniref:50S ribosomal protein L10 n=1 Tax=Coccolithus braarudii TaxID=221442 RepID=A0A7S0Q7R3_9EUKA|mmetsp:Transcript_44817/g.95351  ORF Transcript_44817/g.95351 Transcript_44817/m.95351 type:complete len:236 (+) Transcript_44817:98-805(+)